MEILLLLLLLLLLLKVKLLPIVLLVEIRFHYLFFSKGLKFIVQFFLWQESL